MTITGTAVTAIYHLPRRPDWGGGPPSGDGEAEFQLQGESQRRVWLIFIPRFQEEQCGFRPSHGTVD
ncbi:hypothetical protein ILYODFUR_028110 [Ilyodon furcidens]|uniref:Uncharacterized protein n=1 Tax=Ilyodon furcidens TaxID=33524 RepID=A0ABV0VHU7_9TELE